MLFRPNKRIELTVLEQGGFNFSSRETVARDVDNIVNTATDPVISVLVTASTVTSELQICQLAEPKQSK